MTAQVTYHASTLVVGEPGKRVRTPLDLIQVLERGGIERVILVGDVACDEAVHEFLREWEPTLDVICVLDQP